MVWMLEQLSITPHWNNDLPGQYLALFIMGHITDQVQRIINYPTSHTEYPFCLDLSYINPSAISCSFI